MKSLEIINWVAEGSERLAATQGVRSLLKNMEKTNIELKAEFAKVEKCAFCGNEINAEIMGYEAYKIHYEAQCIDN